MKLSKFQQTLLERPQPPTAFDVLEELVNRLGNAGNVFPPGVLPQVGAHLGAVLQEVKFVKATKAASKKGGKTGEGASE